MKYTRKLLSILLTLVMLFSFAGCDLESYEYDSNSSTISSTSETSNPSSTGEDINSEESSQPSDTSSTQTQKPSSVGSGTATAVKPSSLPKYSGEAYVVVNNNQPNFSASELTTKGYEKYSTYKIYTMDKIKSPSVPTLYEKGKVSDKLLLKLNYRESITYIAFE